eukprot:CAMPEP_0198343806 /NCGR_PEP_ID=MMETSP1450-20131203/62845_1 /TAXON_ID=753684 ORGANISM="Madagascaria erythrocladiodes, Strain CCMP3234" /NCGR_SAMPLE_ID=MMETSP1450 /ASSEMBLY_ACC=CAM_ASM_001115 /LENGTH=203 /DNA_ID=CAMNT_0044049009 /DNA_START=55 /DNA_END=662 /DNA_ORIENTATION=+
MASSCTFVGLAPRIRIQSAGPNSRRGACRGPSTGRRTLPRMYAHGEKVAFPEYCKLLTGVWNSERTYHYLTPDSDGATSVERSQTTFHVARLSDEEANAVVDVTGYPREIAVGEAIGISVSFDTYMEEMQEYVRSSTNLVFVPEEVSGEEVSGAYLRDQAYEEREPKAATFVYNAGRRELLMQTRYTRIVAVDSITLINDHTR